MHWPPNTNNLVVKESLEKLVAPSAHGGRGRPRSQQTSRRCNQTDAPRRRRNLIYIVPPFAVCCAACHCVPNIANSNSSRIRISPRVSSRAGWCTRNFYPAGSRPALHAHIDTGWFFWCRHLLRVEWFSDHVVTAPGMVSKKFDQHQRLLHPPRAAIGTGPDHLLIPAGRLRICLPKP